MDVVLMRHGKVKQILKIIGRMAGCFSDRKRTGTGS